MQNNITTKLKILFFGTPEFVIPILDTLYNNFEVIGIITTPDVVVGRKKIITPTPVKKYALDNKISLFKLEELSNLKGNVDLFVVAAYGHIIKQSILDLPKFGAINIHPSLLPKYRGPSPIQTALLKGEKENGITIIKMDKDVDHGPILKKIPFEVLKSDTFESLHTKMFKIAADALPDVITDFVNNKLTPTPQNDNEATFTKHLTKKDGFFEIENPPNSKKLQRMIRAYFPWPTTWTKVEMKNKEIKIMKFLPGNIIQLEGGKVTPIKDFLNGHPEMRAKIEKFFEKDN